MNSFSEHPLFRVHTLDSAMGSLWSFYKKHFAALFFTSFVYSLITQLIMTQVNLGDMSAYMSDPTKLLEFYKGMLGPILEVAGVSIIFNLILQYYVLFNPIGDHPDILRSALKSFRFLPAYIVIMILFGFMATIASIFGLLLFFVGIIFAIFWLAMVYMFILPVLLAEGNNISNAVTRSFSLSHKEFWKNLGWVATIILILLVVSIVGSVIIMIPFTGNIFKTLSNPQDISATANFSASPLYLGLSSLMSALVTPLLPVFSAILYFNATAKQMPEIRREETGEPFRVRVEDLYAKPYSDDHPDNPDNKK